jgi:hypothetical protein
MSVVKICVAIDESQTSRKALDWAMQHLYSSETTHLDLVTVMQPLDAAVYPVAPIATAGAVNAVVQGWEATRKHEQAHAAELLRQAAEECVRHYNVRGPPGGGGGGGRAAAASWRSGVSSHGSRPLAPTPQVPRAQIQAHALPAAGGASGAQLAGRNCTW